MPWRSSAPSGGPEVARLLVVKVGGSLYDLPDLGPRLRGFLSSLGAVDHLIVPGGGPATEAVRSLDRDHGLGPAPSHWLALRACSVNAHFLACLLPGARVASSPQECRGTDVLDPYAFISADEGRPGCLPHCWDATSDSVAARAAVVAGAGLVLLKSVTLPPDVDWFAAARAGHVDPVLPEIIRSTGLRAWVVNLREWHPASGG
jgi:5-(aminomethyl)-3-furanmethanol phosphate kinase